MHRGPVLLLVLTAFSVGLAESASAASGPVARAAAKGTVLAPGDGSVVRSHTVRLRVRASDRPGALRATLNGRSVGDEFAPARKGVRTLSTSVSHGLRRGRNTLRVTVRRLNGKVGRTTIRFTIRTPRTLTGAGRDRRVAVGSTTTLVGATRATGERGTVRWRLVSGPGTAKDVSRQAKLSSPAGLDAGFRPLEPGRYSVQLTAGPDGRASSDRVTLTAVPPTPLVPLDTMPATSGSDYAQRGIKVGDTTYFLKDAKGFGGYADIKVQVVVLDRRTLALESNAAYDERRDLRDGLAKLRETAQLVIVSFQPDCGKNQLQFIGIEDDLRVVGFPAIGTYPRTPGSISGIAVPGMKPGDADVSIAPLDKQGTCSERTWGRLEGNLVPDQHGNYGYVPAGRVPFAFEPPSPCTRGADCPVGFRLRVKDGRTLGPMKGDGVYYATGDPSLTAEQQTQQARAMTASLTSLGYGSVVTIETWSRPDGNGGYLPPVGAIERKAMNQLATAVASVGGTRNGFNRIARATGPATSNGGTYLLVGGQGLGEGAGAQAAANVDGAGSAPVLSGVYRPDRQGHYRPAEVVGALTGSDSLASVALGASSKDWPLSDERHTKAIRYIGGKVDLLGQDPRAAYWTQAFTQSDTLALVAQVEAVEFEDGQGFSEKDFGEARTQLVKELGWVGNVRSYITKLKSPFTDNATQHWAAAQIAADEVYESVRRPEGEGAMAFVEFTELLLEAYTPVLGEATAAFATALEAGMWAFGAGQHGEPTGDEVRFKADQLGQTLINQAQTAKATMDRMGDIIVSDPAKLELVGRYGGCPASEDRCPEWLALSKADLERNTEAVSHGARAFAYQKLFPLGYRVMALTRVGFYGSRSTPAHSTDPDVRNYRCSTSSVSSSSPFSRYESKDESVSLLQELDPAGKDNKYDTFAFAAPPGPLSATAAPPSKELLDKMFEEPKDGGLGIDPTYFAERAPHGTWQLDKDLEYERCYWSG